MKNSLSENGGDAEKCDEHENWYENEYGCNSALHSADSSSRGCVASIVLLLVAKSFAISELLKLLEVAVVAFTPKK